MPTPTFPVAPPPPLWIALARHELARLWPGPVTLQDMPPAAPAVPVLDGRAL